MRQILPLLFFLSFHVANAQLSGIKTVGSGGDYATLTGAGGAFAAINSNGLLGNLELQIISDITTEDGSIDLNQWSESGAGNYTLKIYPIGTARALSGTSTSGLIRFNGADRVTINGSLSGLGSDRSLSVTNTSSSAGSACIQIASLGAGLGATDNVLKNLNITGGINSVLTFGISVGNTVGSPGADNDRLTIQNNFIVKVGCGIYVSGIGVNAAGAADSVTINGNTVGPATTGLMDIGRYGIYAASILTSNISNNTISNVTAIESSQVGILLATNVSYCTVSSNTITKVSCAFAGVVNGLSVGSNCTSITVEKNVISGIYNNDVSGHAARGISIATESTTSEIVVKNNSISDIISYGGVLQPNDAPLYSPVGIYLTGNSNGVAVYSNSVNLYGSHVGLASGSATACFFVDANVSGLDVRNNIFSNTYDNSSCNNTLDNNYGIISAESKAAFTFIDYNDYAIDTSTSSASYYPGRLTGNFTTLSSIKQFFGGNVNSILAPVQFTSPTNLLPVNANGIIGDYLMDVTEDINSTNRFNPPAMGAFEIALSGIWSTTAATSAWETAINWRNGLVPLTSSTVYIPSTSTNMPSLFSNASIQRIINNGTLTLVGSTTLAVQQHIYNNGLINGVDASLVLNGSKEQNITLTGTSGSININNFTLNNTVGATINLEIGIGTINVYNTLNLVNGILSTGDRLTLKSSSIKTARVPAITGSIIGKVTVETYIPSGRRAFRFIGHPFSETFGISTIADDIDITGNGGATNGFTTTATNSASAFWFNNATGDTSAGINPGWTAFTNTSTIGGNDWRKGQGIRVLVRGAKGEGLNGNSYTPGAVTLSMSGTLNTGAQTTNLAYVNSGYNLIGNPYACPIDIGSKMAGVSFINGSVFWVWDPYAATSGSYVPVAIGGAFNLQVNGVAVVDVRSGSSMDFTEADKVATSTQPLLRNAGKSSLLELQVLSNGNYWDKLFVSNNKAAQPEKDAKDGMKMMNTALNFYTLSANNYKLSLDARPMESEVIPIGFTTSVLGTYTLHVADFGIDSNIQVSLHDKLLNTYIRLADATDYSFQVTADTATQGENRFELVNQKVPAILTVATTFDFKLSPNPASDMVKVNFTNKEEVPTTITIINVEGKTVKIVDAGKVKYGQISISLHGLAKGSYYISLQSGLEKRGEKLQIL